MTVVAWDGTTLAADKAATSCGFRYTVTKLHRLNGCLVALTGDESDAMALLDWLRHRKDASAYPKALESDNATAWVVEPDGSLWKYTKGPYPTKVEERHMAAGSGRDYALAAMHLGCDARRAVEVACHFDINCGNGIDTLTLE